jgi:hypothetical protein
VKEEEKNGQRKRDRGGKSRDADDLSRKSQSGCSIKMLHPPVTKGSTTLNLQKEKVQKDTQIAHKKCTAVTNTKSHTCQPIGNLKKNQNCEKKDVGYPIIYSIINDSSHAEEHIWQVLLIGGIWVHVGPV